MTKKEIVISAENGDFIGKLEKIEMSDHIDNTFRRSVTVHVEVDGDLIDVDAEQP